MFKPFKAGVIRNGQMIPMDSVVFSSHEGEPLMCIAPSNEYSYITRDQTNTFFGTVNTIWGTVEADAWSCDLGYNDYLHICEVRNTKPVSEAAYTLFRQAFHQAMADDQTPYETSKTQYDDGSFDPINI